MKVFPLLNVFFFNFPELLVLIKDSRYFRGIFKGFSIVNCILFEIFLYFLGL